MDYSILAISAAITLIAAALTVPAGFGLATMLTPVVLLLLPPHEAIAVVALIHAAHNAWKLKVLRSSVDFSALKHYGWAMVIGALIGASLNSFIDPNPLLLIVGIALVILPLLTISEKWTNFRIPEAEDRLGGFGSGMLGGLTGHQGALRAMFLQNRLPDKTAYAATAAVLALVVDLSRIPVYLFRDHSIINENWILIVVLVLCAIIGVHIGKRWLIKWKNNTIRSIILTGIVASGVLYIIEAAKEI